MSWCISDTHAEFPPTMKDQLSNHRTRLSPQRSPLGSVAPLLRATTKAPRRDFLHFSLPPFSSYPQVLFLLKEIPSTSHTPPTLCKLRSCGPLPGLMHSFPAQAPCSTWSHAPPQPEPPGQTEVCSYYPASLGTSTPIPHRRKPGTPLGPRPLEGQHASLCTCISLHSRSPGQAKSFHRPWDICTWPSLQAFTLSPAWRGPHVCLILQGTHFQK